MRKIKNLFDYMYYRIYKFYYKWDKETGITAIVALSMFQSMSLNLIFIIVLKLFFSKWEIVPFSKLISWGGVILSLLLTIINQKYYSDKYEYLNSIWKNENRKIRKKRGWLVILLLATPIIILMYLGILNRN